MLRSTKYRLKRAIFNGLLIVLCLFIAAITITYVVHTKHEQHEQKVLDEVRDVIIDDMAKTHPGTWCVSVWRAESNNRNIVTFHGVAVDNEGYPYVYLVVQRDGEYHAIQMFFW